MEQGIRKKVIEREKLEALNKDADFGKLISVERAEALIMDIHSDIGEWVLRACNQNVDPDERIAIRHYTTYPSDDIDVDNRVSDRIYIIGKNRNDKRIEVTIEGGFAFGPYQYWKDLNIHLKYDGDDIGFQPEILNTHPGRNIPLKREYGATILVNGSEERREEPSIWDERLNGLVDEFHKSSRRISDRKYFGLERRRRLNKDFSLEQLSKEIEKITGLAKALEEQEKFEHYPLIFDYDWHSKDRLVDLALFPEEDMAVYVIFRYYQERRYGSYLIQEQDEITVGAVRQGVDYKKMRRRNNDLRNDLVDTKIGKVAVTNKSVIVDFYDGRKNLYSFQFGEGQTEE